jgi:hypothetical protein
MCQESGSERIRYRIPFLVFRFHFYVTKEGNCRPLFECDIREANIRPVSDGSVITLFFTFLYISCCIPCDVILTKQEWSKWGPLLSDKTFSKSPLKTCLHFLVQSFLVASSNGPLNDFHESWMFFSRLLHLYIIVMQTQISCRSVCWYRMTWYLLSCLWREFTRNKKLEDSDNMHPPFPCERKTEYVTSIHLMKSQEVSFSFKAHPLDREPLGIPYQQVLRSHSWRYSWRFKSPCCSLV